MITRRHGPLGVVSRGPRDSDLPVTLVMRPITSVVLGTISGQSIVSDEVRDNFTGSSVTNEGVVEIAAPLDAQVEWTNLAPDIASFSETTLRLTWVKNGTASIMARVGFMRKRASISVTKTEGQSGSTFKEFAAGSLARHREDWVLAALAGKIAGDSTQLITQNGVANSSIWTGSLDLSCVPVAHSGGWPQGCLIAPRFMVVAAHVGVSVGATYTFRRADGTTAVCAVVDKSDLGDDCMLVLLGSAPSGVQPARILPENFASFQLAGEKIRTGCPVLKWKRVGGPRIGVGVGQFSSGTSGPRRAELAPWYVDWVAGDSGSAFGAVISGNFVFYGNAWTGPGANDDGGSWLAGRRAELIATMNTMIAGSSSTLTEIDLSGFPTY